jgi:hypothetical protein
MTLTPPEPDQLAQITARRGEMAALHTRIGRHFPRPEVRERAGRFFVGLLDPVERRNGW